MVEHLFMERLFRGKSKEPGSGKGKWVFGGICDWGGGIEILEVQNDPGSFYEPPSTEIDEIEVERNSVGQFSGITDKNQTPVFELDIIEHQMEMVNGTKKKARGVIKFGSYTGKSGSAEVGFYIEWNEPFYKGMMRNDLRYWIEDGGLHPAVVVGNIIDNPELLEESEESNQ